MGTNPHSKCGVIYMKGRYRLITDAQYYKCFECHQEFNELLDPPRDHPDHERWKLCPECAGSWKYIECPNIYDGES
jgi:uncharacterized CHY-type Zn-finger protein